MNVREYALHLTGKRAKMAGNVTIHREILYRSDRNGGSEILLIHRDPLLAILNPPFGAFDLPSSTFSGLSLALILFRTKL